MIKFPNILTTKIFQKIKVPDANKPLVAPENFENDFFCFDQPKINRTLLSDGNFHTDQIAMASAHNPPSAATKPHDVDRIVRGWIKTALEPLRLKHLETDAAISLIQSIAIVSKEYTAKPSQLYPSHINEKLNDTLNESGNMLLTSQRYIQLRVAFPAAAIFTYSEWLREIFKNSKKPDELDELLPALKKPSYQNPPSQLLLALDFAQDYLKMESLEMIALLGLSAAEVRQHCTDQNVKLSNKETAAFLNACHSAMSTDSNFSHDESVKIIECFSRYARMRISTPMNQMGMLYLTKPQFSQDADVMMKEIIKLINFLSLKLSLQEAEGILENILGKNWKEDQITVKQFFDAIIIRLQIPDLELEDLKKLNRDDRRHLEKHVRKIFERNYSLMSFVSSMLNKILEHIRILNSG